MWHTYVSHIGHNHNSLPKSANRQLFAVMSLNGVNVKRPDVQILNASIDRRMILLIRRRLKYNPHDHEFLDLKVRRGQ